MAKRACPVCGCRLDGDVDQCPLCGADVEPAEGAAEDSAEGADAPDTSPRDVAARHIAGLPVSRRRLVQVAGVGAVLAVGGLVVWGIGRDAALRQRAEEVAKSGDQLVETDADAAAVAGDPVCLAGNAMAGGALAQVGEMLYQVRSDGIYCIEGLAARDVDQAKRLCAARASWLVAAKDALWYLDADEGSAPAAYRTGARRLCRLSLKGASFEPEVMYAAPGDMRLSSCVGDDNGLWFLQHESDGFTVLVLKAAGEEPVTRHRIGAERAWLVADAGACYAVQSGTDSWSVTRAAGVEGAFEPLAEGAGALRTACLNEGVLYGVTVGAGESAGRFMANDLRGNMAEYPDLGDAAIVAADGAVVAVMRTDGTVSWLNSETGFTHEVSWFGADEPSLASPESSTLAVRGGTIYGTGLRGSACALDVNTEERSSTEEGS